MRSVELTRSGFVHGGRVLPSAVTLGLCPVGQIWLDLSGPWTDQDSLTSSRLSNCSLVKENCMTPKGRNAGSGMVAKLPTLSTPWFERFSLWTTRPPSTRPRELALTCNSISDSALRIISYTDNGCYNQACSMLAQKFSGFVEGAPGCSNVVQQEDADASGNRSRTSPRHPVEFQPLQAAQRGLSDRRPGPQAMHASGRENRTHASRHRIRVIDPTPPASQRRRRHRNHAPTTRRRRHLARHRARQLPTQQVGHIVPGARLHALHKPVERRRVATEPDEPVEQRLLQARRARQPAIRGGPRRARVLERPATSPAPRIGAAQREGLPHRHRGIRPRAPQQHLLETRQFTLHATPPRSDRHATA